MEAVQDKIQTIQLSKWEKHLKLINDRIHHKLARYEAFFLLLIRKKKHRSYQESVKMCERRRATAKPSLVCYFRWAAQAAPVHNFLSPS